MYHPGETNEINIQKTSLKRLITNCEWYVGDAGLWLEKKLQHSSNGNFVEGFKSRCFF